jgi:hypothetical protein
MKLQKIENAKLQQTSKGVGNMPNSLEDLNTKDVIKARPQDLVANDKLEYSINLVSNLVEMNKTMVLKNMDQKL